MTSQPQYLGAERRARHRVVLRCPLRPPFPYIAATPARKHKDTPLVGQPIESVRFQLAFQADRVQMQIAHHLELLREPSRLFAQEHILRPSSATDEHRTPIHTKETRAFVGQLRCNFTNSNPNHRLVRELAV